MQASEQIKDEPKEQVEVEEQSAEPEQQPRLSKLEEEQGAFLMEFAKNNYKKIISPNGRQIKINGTFYDLVKVTEAVEDEFVKRELACNSANPSKPKESRKAIYDFLTFTTSVTEDALKNTDRGELRNICAIIGMINKGFRNLQ